MREPMDIRQMRQWWETQLIDMYGKMSRTAVSSRLNSMSKGIDSWIRLYKLENESIGIEELSERLAELETRLKGGPTGIIHGNS